MAPIFARLRKLLQNGLSLIQKAFERFASVFRAPQSTHKKARSTAQSSKFWALAYNAKQCTGQDEATSSLAVDASQEQLPTNGGNTIEKTDGKPSATEELKESTLPASTTKGLRFVENAFRRFSAVFRIKSTDKPEKPSVLERDSKINTGQDERTPNLVAGSTDEKMMKNDEHSAQKSGGKAFAAEDQKESTLPKSTFAAPVTINGPKRTIAEELTTGVDEKESKTAANDDDAIADLPRLVMKGTNSKPGILSRLWSNLSSASEISDKPTDK